MRIAATAISVNDIILARSRCSGKKHSLEIFCFTNVDSLGKKEPCAFIDLRCHTKTSVCNQSFEPSSNRIWTAGMSR